MIELWAGIGILLLIAVALLLWPLTRARRVFEQQTALEHEVSDECDNIAVFRDRAAGLDEELARGDIDQARFDERRLELERDLLADTDKQPLGRLKSAYSGRWLTGVVVVMVGFGSLYGYHRGGEADNLALYQARLQVERADGGAQQFMTRFEQEAQAQPDNPNVWASLYPLYRDSQQYEKADQALVRIIDLKGREPDLLAELAQIRFVENDRRMNDDVKKLVDEVLKNDPRQPNAHGLLGFGAFSAGNYQRAIDHWRIAIAGTEDEGNQKVLRQAMAAARARMGLVDRKDP